MSHLVGQFVSFCAKLERAVTALEGSLARVRSNVSLQVAKPWKLFETSLVWTDKEFFDSRYFVALSLYLLYSTIKANSNLLGIGVKSLSIYL